MCKSHLLALVTSVQDNKAGRSLMHLLALFFSACPAVVFSSALSQTFLSMAQSRLSWVPALGSLGQNIQKPHGPRQH